ncbi:MAG TPA: HAMP domain-containing sensor histidine kinase [Pyrinomonadaceae bacterium]|nr:HAMP domain-containing sensor histidine kinase [Pyrinomonadaceae bacterium]
MRRRKAVIFFLVFGICLVALAVALNVGWVLLSLREVVLMVLGIIFFALIITGLILNMIFLVREIRRNEQQDAFLNAMTHELKTPIASIKLYLETLKTRDVAEVKKQEFYDIMLTDSNRLLTTVEQVLQAGRSRENQRQLNISEIELNNLLAESIKIVQTRYNLDESAIKFSESAEAATISGDKSELQTVFINLLDNAVKYSGDEPKISIRVKNTHEKKVEIFIKDNGIGLESSELKRIFKRFYRVGNTSTQEKKGTGLGLFIVQSIIKKHGGKVSADSKGEGKGSTFIVQLPKIVSG